jgi:hypothetical protein
MEANAQAIRTCPNGSLPYFLVGVTKKPIHTWSESSLPPSMTESYINCVQKNPDGTFNRTSTFRREIDGIYQDTVNRQEFSSRGFEVIQMIPPYGKVLVNRMKCENCNWSQDLLSISLNVLHRFNIFGKRRSDYREYIFNIKQNLFLGPNVAPTMMDHGEPFHVISFEKNNTGAVRARFSACANNALTITECLNQPNGNLKKVRDIEFKELRHSDMSEIYSDF